MKRTDCSVSDGAAAIIDTATALGCRKAVAIRSRAHVNDFLPMSKRDILSFDGCAKAWHDVQMANVTLNDLSFVETHDCFTTAELLEYEAMGLAEPGEGARVVSEGLT